MVFRKEVIAADVRVALDENPVNEALLDEGDEQTLCNEDIVSSKIEEGARKVLLLAPVYMLEQGHPLPSEVYWDGRGSGHVMLPDDFLRLQVFKMSDWVRAVYGAISIEDAAYIRQSSRWKGLRGNRERPVCAIGIRPEGKVLEFYSCGSEKATVAMGMYVPRPTFDSEGGIDLPERCYRAVVYMICSLVAAAYGEAERSAMFEKLCGSEIGRN